MRSIRCFLVLFALFALAACEIEGGVPRPTNAPLASAVPLPNTPGPAAASSVAAPSVAPTVAADSGLRIGLLNDPGDLLPYYSDSADERLAAPVTELLFPAPLLTLHYSYTTTGILDRVPSIANGDIQAGSVDVFLDQVGVITTTNTGVITQVQQISVLYHWNPELRWADGTPVTADDSLFAYELAKTTDLGQDAASRLELIERYEQVDAHTTRAVLRADYNDPAAIATYWTPLPRHLLEDVDPSELRSAEFALLPIGYGPYSVERRDQSSLRLRRNPHWPGPQPSADVVTFIFRDNLELLSSSVAGGSLDVAAFEQPRPEQLATLRQAADSGSLSLSTAASPIWEHLDFNLDVPLFQDIRMRRAIALAIDRQAMVDTLLGGYGSVLESWVVPGQWPAVQADQLTRYPYNPDEARRLLDEAGYADSDADGLREAGGKPLVFSLITTAGSPLRLAAAKRIKADLAAVGVGLELTELSAPELYGLEGPLYRRSFELALFAWIAGPEPRGWERWSCAGVPSEANGWTGNNFSGWCFFEADKAIRTATTALDQRARAAAYLRQQQLFSQELPVLPLFQRIDIAISSPTITGVQADSTAPFTWNLTRWVRK